MKALLVFTTAFIAISQAQAASFCNAGGADGLMCTSKDQKTAVYIHPRPYYSTGLSLNGFCEDGYLKIGGEELNGKLDGINLDEAEQALNNVQAVTAWYGKGVTINNPEDRNKTENVNTSIAFQFNDWAAKKVQTSLSLKDAPDSGEVTVAVDQKSAKMYIQYGDQNSATLDLTCE